MYEGAYVQSGIIGRLSLPDTVDEEIVLVHVYLDAGSAAIKIQ